MFIVRYEIKKQIPMKKSLYCWQKKFPEKILKTTIYRLWLF
jgi:hypothetical protein